MTARPKRHSATRGLYFGMAAACLLIVSTALSQGNGAASEPETVRHTDNWPSWRGPSGQGYADVRAVPLIWSETLNLLWKTDFPGRGNSSPIVWGDRIFLTAASANGDERLVLCIRAADGMILWKQVAS